MKQEFLDERRQGLEEEYFRRREAALQEKLRTEEQRRAAREALRAASRITDEALLDQLVALNIKPDTLTALSLIPLVEIGWADGSLTVEERKAILAAAEQVGLQERSGGYLLLQDCLSHRPKAHLLEMWTHYIRNLCAQLSTAERSALKTDLLERAHSVAIATGGFLGIGSRISNPEKRVLDEIGRVFEA